MIMESKSMSNLKHEPIAICGAGIGGLVLALRLHDLGFKPTVFEARTRSAVESEGEFFTLAPNGMNGLKVVGCLDAVVSAGIDTTALEFRNARGRTLATADQSDHGRTFGAPSVTLPRGALAGILIEHALAKGIQIEFAKSVETVSAARDSVSLIFADGGSHNASILVAADGLRSSVRKLVFPDYPAPKFTGLVGAGGCVEADVPSTDGAMRMTFGEKGFFGYIKRGGGPVYWFTSYVANDPFSEEHARTRADFVRRLHAQDADPIPRILREVTVLERAYPIFAMPSLPRWSSGRTVLLGDAAHAVGPHAGQGASMAIEDAIVLAACLNAEHDHGQAFERYERLRRPRIDDVVRLTARNASSKGSPGLIGRFIRDLILPFVLPIGMRAGRKLFRFRVDLEPLTDPSR